MCDKFFTDFGNFAVHTTAIHSYNKISNVMCVINPLLNKEILMCMLVHVILNTNHFNVISVQKSLVMKVI